MKLHKFRAWDKHAKKMVSDFVIAPTSPSWGAFPIESPKIFEKALKMLKDSYGDELKGVKELEDIMSYLTTSDYTLTDWANYYGLNNYHIMQYIGIKDKDNTEIFENDIWKGPCIYGPAGWSETTLTIPSIDQFYKNYGFGDWEKGTVIGNTYLNPELINKTSGE